MKTGTQRALRWTIFAVLALVALYAGMRTGSGLRAKNEKVVEAPEFPFKPGDALPDVMLTDSTDARMGSVALVAERKGAVMLFLDPNCEGCSAMAAKWQHAVDQGAIEPERVIAITTATREQNSSYRAKHLLGYPVYRDVESAFIQRYGVVTYPMEMEVNASGIIQALSTDSKSVVDGESVRGLIDH
jgi:peroxiredoxin